jgi:SSS family transporter
MAEPQFALTALDLAVIALYLVACLAIGFFVGRGQKDLADYAVGGRDLPWWAVLGSIIATETSSVTFLSIPGLAYGGDLRFLQLPIGYMIGRLLIVVLFLPHYFRGELLSAYEVLSLRFGGPVRKLAALLFLIMRTLADGLRLYLTAIVVQQVTGLPLNGSILVVGLTTVAYTLFGGMKSVVWTDCLQLVVYLAGALLAGWLMIGEIPGGWDEFVAFGSEQGKFRLLDLSIDPKVPYTLWAGLIGGIFLSMATHGADQLMVQRYLCARSQRDAGKALAISGIFIFAQFALFLLIGVGLACYYHHVPPREAFPKNDFVFATFIAQKLPSGVVGLTIAAVVAAAMSTLSSSLNSSASTLLNDLYLPVVKREVSAREQLWLGRVLSALFGVAQILVGIAGQKLSDSVVETVMKIAGITTGAVLGVFFLGMLSRRATRTGALVGLIGGLSVVTAVAFGTKLAWTWYTVVGTTATLGIGHAVSWLSSENVDNTSGH